MTGYTYASGAVASGPGRNIYGPYVQGIPKNPFNGLGTVEIEKGQENLGLGNYGWHFNTQTGDFHADTDAHKGL